MCMTSVTASLRARFFFFFLLIRSFALENLVTKLVKAHQDWVFYLYHLKLIQILVQDNLLVKLVG